MPDRRIPADDARWLVSQLVRMRLPLAPLLQGTDLDEAWLHQKDAKITRAQFQRLVANALEISGDPALGLTIGEYFNLGDYGFWGYAILSSSTWGEANAVALKYWDLSGGLVRIVFTSGAELSTWQMYPAFPMDSLALWQFGVEEQLSAWWTALRLIGTHQPEFSEIRLSYPEPEHGDRYRALFGCPVYFEEAVTLFRTPTAHLDRPTATGHPQVAVVCKRQCQDILETLHGADELIGAVRERVLLSPGRFPRVDEMAEHLALSPRTLRRRLRERGTTYQALLDEVRGEVAKQYLRTTNLSTDQIADRLGFAETTSFRRAFTKWTGKTPRAFRQRA